MWKGGNFRIMTATRMITFFSLDRNNSDTVVIRYYISGLFEGNRIPRVSRENARTNITPGKCM